MTSNIYFKICLFKNIIIAMNITIMWLCYKTDFQKTIL